MVLTIACLAVLTGLLALFFPGLGLTRLGRERKPWQPPRPRRGQSPPRVKFSQAALRRLTWEVLRHAREHPNTEMGVLLLGSWRDGVPWITQIIDQGPGAIFTSSSVKFDGEYQATLFRVSRWFSPRDRLLGVAHLHPAGLARPSSGDYAGDIEWLREEGAPKPGVFVIITPPPSQTACDVPSEEAFEERDGFGLALRGVTFHAYLLAPGAPAYLEARVETSCGPDSSSRTARFQSLVRQRYRESARVLERFPNAELRPIWLGLEPALAIPFEEDGIRGLNILTASETRWIADGGGRLHELVPSPGREIVAADLEMISLLGAATNGSEPSRLETPRPEEANVTAS